MRLLFITRKWPPAVGGMETWSAELVRELRHHDLTLHALPGRQDGRAPSPSAILDFGLRTAWSLLRGRGGFDVIQGGDMAIWPLVWLAGCRSRKAKLSLAAHGTDVAYAERSGIAARIYERYLRLGARMLDGVRIIANSRATAARARALGFRHVAVIPLATRSFAPLPPVAPEPFLLFAGRLVRRKGLSWFVAHVLPRLPEPIELRVAGTVWDESERAALDHPRVRYLGHVSQEDLSVLAARALVVIVPNIPAGPGHFEGFGLVAVEAAAAGSVVIASRLDGFTDSVIDGETGLLVSPGDATAWVEAIERVAGWTDAERRRYVARARDLACRHFDWARVARETEAAWQAE